MISTKALFLTPIYGVFGFILVTLGRAEGPGVELYLAPFIQNESTANAVRYESKACFDWTYDKVKNGFLIEKQFFIERDDGIRFPTDEWRPDLGIPSNNSTTARAGTRRTIPECVHIPKGMRTAGHFWVRGINVYRPWHQLWNVEQPVVSVEFGAVSSNRFPHDDHDSPAEAAP